MKIKSLKIGLKFWHEIVCAIPLGILLVDMITKHSIVFHQTFDIACFCYFLILFICFIGQFFWKNKNVAFFLSILSGLNSIFLIFASLYAFRANPNKIQAIAMLIYGLFLIVVAIKMHGKFSPNNYSS